MTQSENILISVRYDYVRKMLDGSKTAELRRRPLRIRPGTHIWVYSKLPRGHVDLVATADEIVAASPNRLWARYRDRIAISHSEFRAYLDGVDVACVVLLRDVTALRPTLDLQSLRGLSKTFQPPQFFRRLLERGPELQSLSQSHPLEA